MTTRVVETVVTNADKPPCRTAAQMTQLCCEKTAALQCCEEVVNAWPGYTAKEIIDHLGLVLDDQGRDKDGRYINIQMQPRKKPCGEQLTKYDTSQKNCCEGVAALAWNMTVTPDVLPHGRSIIIAWTGSDGRQVEVVTTSNATWFSDGRKTAIGYGNSITLFAGPTFCGATEVTVRDGCSTSTIMICSDLGRWQYLGAICVLPDIEDQNVSFSDWMAQVGNLRQFENVVYQQTTYGLQNQDNCAELPGICGEPGRTCLALSSAINNCNAAVGYDGHYKCNKSGMSQRRADAYADHGYLRFYTAYMTAYKWSC